MDYSSIWRYIRGRILIPDGIIERKEKILLHVSDTPRAIFGAINELVEIIEPEYIVHTGDLVDNLKLEIYPGLAPQYLKDVTGILDIIKKSKEKSYIVLGNHDLPEIMDNSSGKLVIESDMIEERIEGHLFTMTHYYQTQAEGEFYLFGHDDFHTSEGNELNGIFSIHIIFLESRKVVRLKYPWGTDDQRLLKRKIGL